MKVKYRKDKKGNWLWEIRSHNNWVMCRSRRTFERKRDAIRSLAKVKAWMVIS
jgi:uncharacterized protein YegP (UPF0339 family)